MQKKKNEKKKKKKESPLDKQIMKTLRKCTDFIRSQIKFYLEFSRWAIFKKKKKRFSFHEGPASSTLIAMLLRFLYA